MIGEEDHDKTAVGFAGLSSLVSEVPSTQSPSPPTADADHDDRALSRQPSVAAPTASANKPANSSKPIFPPSGPSPNVGAWVFLGLAVLVIVGLIWVGSQSNGSNSEARVTHVPSAPLVPDQPPQESLEAQPPPAMSYPSEIKPPVGKDNRLSVGEIRYCLAESARLDGAKPAVNQYSESEIERYNAMIADYNGRCGSFMYRRGDLAQARSDISPYLNSLKAQGYARFASRRAATTSAAAAASDPTVKSVQRRLDALGYNAGYADGVMGERTRSAIRSFQHDSGLPVDGIVTGPLVLALQTAPSAPKDHKLSTIGRARTAGNSFVHAKRIHGTAAIYPTDSLLGGHQGSVILSVTVGLDGGVTSVNVKTSSGYPELDRSAVQAAENWTFSPAAENGHPVIDTLTIPVRFSADATR